MIRRSLLHGWDRDGSEAGLLARLPSQNKKQREGLSLLVARALDVRRVNLNELAAAVPRAAERLDVRYQWISRILGDELIASTKSWVSIRSVPQVIPG